MLGLSAGAKSKECSIFETHCRGIATVWLPGEWRRVVFIRWIIIDFEKLMKDGCINFCLKPRNQFWTLWTLKGSFRGQLPEKIERWSRITRRWPRFCAVQSIKLQNASNDREIHSEIIVKLAETTRTSSVPRTDNRTETGPDFLNVIFRFRKVTITGCFDFCPFCAICYLQRT